MAHTPWVQCTVVTSALRRHSSSSLETQSISRCDLLSLVDPTYTDAPRVTLWDGIKEFMTMRRMLMFSVITPLHTPTAKMLPPLLSLHWCSCYSCSSTRISSTLSWISCVSPGLSVLDGLVHSVPPRQYEKHVAIPISIIQMSKPQYLEVNSFVPRDCRSGVQTQATWFQTQQSSPTTLHCLLRNLTDLTASKHLWLAASEHT